MIFRKTWTLTCKLHIKGTIFMKTWNDPTVITVILPQPVWLETPIKVKCLTKVLKVIFSKVWDSVWGLYSIIWYSSCCNFDADSIRTRLAWSWGSRIPKNHEFRSAWSRVSRNSKNHKFIIYSSSFGGRRQRRQPVNCNPRMFWHLIRDHFSFLVFLYRIRRRMGGVSRLKHPVEPQNHNDQ